jgi:hypothetical protein
LQVDFTFSQLTKNKKYIIIKVQNEKYKKHENNNTGKHEKYFHQSKKATKE